MDSSLRAFFSIGPADSRRLRSIGREPWKGQRPRFNPVSGHHSFNRLQTHQSAFSFQFSNYSAQNLCGRFWDVLNRIFVDISVALK
jgi:hypothetical protein